MAVGKGNFNNKCTLFYNQIATKFKLVLLVTK